MLTGVLLTCSLLALVSAWNQPTTCYVRQTASKVPVDLSGVESELRLIRELLQTLTAVLTGKNM